MTRKDPGKTANTERSKLLASAKKLGAKVADDAQIDDIRRAINEKLGFPDDNAENPAGQTDEIANIIVDNPDAVAGELTNLPSDFRTNIPNLAPNGRWEGKRARIVRTRTGHNDMAGAIFRWNGWPTIIPIEVACDVAWPIYEAIRECRGTRASVRQVEHPTDPGKVNNVVETTKYDKYPYQFLGVTPGTEHLPESALEYVLDQYAEDFPGYSLRMWRQLCALFELSDPRCGIKPGMMQEEEIKVRRNALHAELNLPMGANKGIRARIRDEKRSEYRMPARAA